MSTCALYADHSGHPPLCGKAAAALLVTACPCDRAHDSARAVCAGCGDALRRRLGTGTVLRCTACRDSPRPHRCTVLVTWAAVEVTA